METVCALFKGCADINRLRILKLLEKKKMCVCELVYILKISQPAISRHLSKLQKAGLIDCKQDGFWKNYYLSAHDHHSKSLLKNLNGWLNNDVQVLNDLERAKHTDRIQLCKK